MMIICDKKSLIKWFLNHKNVISDFLVPICLLVAGFLTVRFGKIFFPQYSQSKFKDLTVVFPIGTVDSTLKSLENSSFRKLKGISAKAFSNPIFKRMIALFKNGVWILKS